MATASPLLRSLLRKHAAAASSSTSSCVVAMKKAAQTRTPASSVRCYAYLASSASESSGSTRGHRRMVSDDENDESNAAPSSSSSTYVSPMQDFWDAVEANRPTTVHDPTVTSSLARTSATATSSTGTLRCGIPESVLRFTTTSYGRTMNAPFVHPKENSVVLKVGTRHLPLTPMEKEILREIVGNRLNDDRNELRLTSDQFGSRIENKRHLVSMLDRIVLSCQRLGREIDATPPQPPSSSTSKS